jgi:hypothetical protein
LQLLNQLCSGSGSRLLGNAFVLPVYQAQPHKPHGQQEAFSLVQLVSKQTERFEDCVALQLSGEVQCTFIRDPVALQQQGGQHVVVGQDLTEAARAVVADAVVREIELFQLIVFPQRLCKCLCSLWTERGMS